MAPQGRPAQTLLAIVFLLGATPLASALRRFGGSRPDQDKSSSRRYAAGSLDAVTESTKQRPTAREVEPVRPEGDDPGRDAVSSAQRRSSEPLDSSEAHEERRALLPGDIAWGRGLDGDLAETSHHDAMASPAGVETSHYITGDSTAALLLERGEERAEETEHTSPSHAGGAFLGKTLSEHVRRALRARGYDAATMDPANNALVACYAIVSFLCLLQTMSKGRLNASLEKAAHQQKKLEKSLGGIIAETQQSLAELQESFTNFAQLTFQERRRDFRRFIKCVRDDNLFGQTRKDKRHFLLFSSFVRRWLAVFAECSRDPISQPLRVVSEGELSRCSTPNEVVALLIDPTPGGTPGPLDVCRVEIMTSATVPTKEDDVVRSKRPYLYRTWCGPVYFNVISLRHATLMCGLILGFVVAALETSIGKWIHAAVLSLSAVCIFINLVRFESIDMLAHLQGEVERLRKKRVELDDARKGVGEFVEEAQANTHFWRNRTIPRLDILKELHEILQDLSDDNSFKLLEGAASKLDFIEEIVGSPSLWSGEDSLDEGKLKLIGSHLSTCANNLHTGSKVDKAVPLKIVEMLCVSGVVGLRGISAMSLVNLKLLGDESNPYVHAAINETTSVQTRVKKFNLHPKWENEELYLRVAPQDKTLKIEVRDHSKMTQDGSMGSASVDATSLERGVWLRQQAPLVGRGQLDFEIVYAVTAEDFIEIPDTDFTQLANSGVQRQSSPPTVMRRTSTGRMGRWTKKVMRTVTRQGEQASSVDKAEMKRSKSNSSLYSRKVSQLFKSKTPLTRQQSGASPSRVRRLFWSGKISQAGVSPRRTSSKGARTGGREAPQVHERIPEGRGTFGAKGRKRDEGCVAT